MKPSSSSLGTDAPAARPFGLAYTWPHGTQGDKDASARAGVDHHHTPPAHPGPLLCVLCVVLRRIFFFSPSGGFSLACFGFGFSLYLAEMSTSGVSLAGNCNAAVGRSKRMIHVH